MFSWVQPSLEMLSTRAYRKCHGMRLNCSDVHPLSQDSRGEGNITEGMATEAAC